MRSKQLYLTFDYELFLGSKSGSVHNCLIKPTNVLLEILKKHLQTGIFFIDTSYLMRLTEISKFYKLAKQDLEKIKNQLIKIVEDGHFIFHHLHPHWFDAQYIVESNEWDLSNNSRFVFQLLSKEEKDKLFSFSNDFLSTIYSEAKSNKLPNGYRAGGLFIEPFDDIKPYFEKYNIQHEFSALPNSERIDFPFTHDFRSVPESRIYNFSEKLNFENISGEFIQYPITRLKIRGLNKILNSLYFRMNKKNLQHKTYGYGKAVSKNINVGIKKKNLTDYLSLELPASVEMLNPAIVRVFMKQLENKSYLHILSHPKLMSSASLKYFDIFLGKVTQKYDLKKIEF